MAVPNMLSTVQSVAARFPEEWACAHTGRSCTEDFIYILAAELHDIDPRFGLNGKRGDPNDISDDAINYKGEGADFDPTNGNAPVTVIDVIGGAGGPNPQPTWAIVTNPAAPVGAAWVQPTEPAPVQPYPDEVTWWEGVFDVEAARIYALKGQPYPSPRSARWSNRTAYDIRGGLTKEQSMAVHIGELKAELGLPPGA